MGFFDDILFQPSKTANIVVPALVKGKYIPILWFVTFIAWKWLLKFIIIQPFRAKLEVSIPNPPTENQLCFSFRKEQENFTNWAVDGAQYAFHEN